MTAERFRLIVDPNRILSTDFQLSVRNGIATFDHGKGFGHGLGLCQWGMQGQALAGRPAGEILRYYYPGATITRVY
jgi:stage II sporulation protein D